MHYHIQYTVKFLEGLLELLGFASACFRITLYCSTDTCMKVPLNRYEVQLALQYAVGVPQ